MIVSKQFIYSNDLNKKIRLFVHTDTIIGDTWGIAEPLLNTLTWSKDLKEWLSPLIKIVLDKLVGSVEYVLFYNAFDWLHLEETDAIDPLDKLHDQLQNNPEFSAMSPNDKRLLYDHFNLLFDIFERDESLATEVINGMVEVIYDVFGEKVSFASDVLPRWNDIITTTHIVSV